MPNFHSKVIQDQMMLSKVFVCFVHDDHPHVLFPCSIRAFNRTMCYTRSSCTSCFKFMSFSCTNFVSFHSLNSSNLFHCYKVSLSVSQNFVLKYTFRAARTSLAFFECNGLALTNFNSVVIIHRHDICVRTWAFAYTISNLGLFQWCHEKLQFKVVILHWLHSVSCRFLLWMEFA